MRPFIQQSGRGILFEAEADTTRTARIHHNGREPPQSAPVAIPTTSQREESSACMHEHPEQPATAAACADMLYRRHKFTPIPTNLGVESLQQYFPFVTPSLCHFL